ncbi:MAG: DUF4411 family protein [Candidatus Electryonea clarkiae]|nr:DUF4411 family protein [Candidatus Electryonea clarkiae]MDP8285215.1 DUF4411 family protein [Candidatus Electryonea clarkiae]
MQTFDASSIIHAWDNYPLDQFPPLWTWMGEQFESEDFVMSEVAFDEMDPKVSDCAKWLKEHAIQKMSVTNETLQIAFMIKELLGIENDRFHQKGVNESDIFIIASAKEHEQELVSNENRQNDLPEEMKKYKIPAVCGMLQVTVPCFSFIEIIKQSKEVFR